MRIAPLATLIIVLFLSTGCSLLPGQEDETKGWSAQRFYNAAKAAMSEGNYDKAVEYFEGLEARYPFGQYALQSQLEVAYAYYKDGKPEAAIAAANRFIKLNPRNPHVDYAYYLKGIVNFNRNLGFINRFVPTDTSQRDAGAALSSFKDFAELVRRYPESIYAEDARLRMIHLRNNVAMHELQVARYYMKRGAWLAAANRANTVIRKYQRTPAVKPALEMLVIAYDKLGLVELSNDAVRVLALNEKKGAFDIPQTEEEKSLIESAWDYFQLDQN